MIESRRGALLGLGNVNRELAHTAPHWRNDDDLCKASKGFHIFVHSFTFVVLGAKMI